MRIRKPCNFTAKCSGTKTIELIGDNDDYLKNFSSFKRRDDYFESGLVGVKMQNLSAFKKVEKVFCSPNTDNLFLVADGGAYVLYKGDAQFTKLKSNVASGSFFADMYLRGSAATVLFDGTNRVIVGGGTATATDSQEFTDGIIHCGRFFATVKDEGLKIVWSSSTPMEWDTGIDGSGCIYLPTDGGKVLRLFNYDEKLVAVRERGITVINAYGEPQNYAVKATGSYLTADGIIADTCAVCDGRLFFCTKSGIFAFDGDDIERQENEFSGDISAYQCAGASGDSYFVVCDSEQFGDGVLFVYQAAEKEDYFVALHPQKVACGDEIIAFCDDGIYKLESGAGFWQSRQVDFESSGNKCLKRVAFDGDGEFELTVTCDGIKKTLGLGSHKLGLFGRKFAFTVSGKGTIKSLSATAEVRDEV